MYEKIPESIGLGNISWPNVINPVTGLPRPISEYVTVSSDPMIYGMTSEVKEFRDCLKAELAKRGMIVHRDGVGPTDNFEVFVDGIGKNEMVTAQSIGFSGDATHQEIADHLAAKFTHFAFYTLDIQKNKDDLIGCSIIFYTMRFHAW